MTRRTSGILGLALFLGGVASGYLMGYPSSRLMARSDRTTRSDDPPPVSGRGDAGAITRELSQNYDLFRVVDRTFELVARVVSPSVVHITARKDGPREDGEVTRFEETGSGVIVQCEGVEGLFVLTNNHVVEGAEGKDISILLHDGQVLKPERLWSDPKADIAVVKLPQNDLPFAKLGNSDDARVGTWVMALGSPFGLTHSVSQGIISARARHELELEFEGVEHQEFLQTDAAINPGNSGGPLVNMKGEVIGINTAIASEHGGSEGVGFSIPINLARWAMTQLLLGGKVSRGAMGINLQELTAAKAVELGLEKPRGARVVVVHEGSPANLAGLVAGDVILRFNGVEIVDYNHLINLVAIAPIGQAFEMTVWRDRKLITAKVTIADRDAIMSKRTPPTPRPRPVGR